MSLTALLPPAQIPGCGGGVGGQQVEPGGPRVKGKRCESRERKVVGCSRGERGTEHTFGGLRRSTVFRPMCRELPQVEGKDH